MSLSIEILGFRARACVRVCVCVCFYDFLDIYDSNSTIHCFVSVLTYMIPIVHFIVSFQL